MARQLVFDLPVREARGRGDFFVSPSNALALATLEQPDAWPQRKLVLAGPLGSGKTHLAHVWAGDTGAVVVAAADIAAADLPALAVGNVAIEDADAIEGNAAAETALFHLHNLIAAQGTRLLITAKLPPVQWNLGLPDLASRMQAAAVARLEAPDDALLAAVLAKLFADRQLAVPAAVIPYLVTHMERSLSVARDLVAAIDAQALAQRRPITRQLAAEVLDRLAPPGA